MKRADHYLIQQVLDGDLTRESFDVFQQRLREEPDLVKLYGDYALLHHTLSEELEGGHAGLADPPDSGRRVSWWIPVIAVAAVCALIAAALLIPRWSGRQSVEEVAVVTFSVDAVWRFEGETRSIGGGTGVARDGVLHLQQGRAGIALEPSVTGVIEGPAKLTFLSPDSIHIRQGRGYFRRGGNGGGLTVATPRLTAVDSATELGIEVMPDGPDELHVAEGVMQVTTKGGNETLMLAAGEAVRVPASGPIERFPSADKKFATSLGRFKTVLSGPFERTQWRRDHGSPSISTHRIEGENYSVFLRLPAPVPGPGGSVLLATLDVGKPTNGAFHTDGWAGMSFFSKGEELLFFGDSYGTKPTWSLDVKQHIPVILPEAPVVGPRMVTLRYDPRSGDVSLHEGGLPLKAPFCSGRIPPGISFDDVRIGASAGASLVVKSLEIRVGED